MSGLIRLSIWCAGFFLAGMTSHAQAPSVVGTWEYMAPRGGLATFTETHYMLVLTEGSEDDTFLRASTDPYRFTSSSRIAATIRLNSDPSRVGTTFTFDYEIEGEVMRYWLLNPDGSRRALVQMRRIEAPSTGSGR